MMQLLEWQCPTCRAWNPGGHETVDVLRDVAICTKCKAEFQTEDIFKSGWAVVDGRADLEA